MIKNYADKVIKEVQADMRKRLRAAAMFLVNETKKTLSVPAPRVRVLSHLGVWYYRAKTKATPGAPPRKLSGRLRASMTYEMDDTRMVVRVGTNVRYAKVHEFRNGHDFLLRTIGANRLALERILGQGFVADVGTATGYP